MEDTVVHGFNATLTLQENGVHIKPGVVGNMFGGGSFLSEKYIPYSTISGVELKKGFPIIGEGYIQITTFDGMENSDSNTGNGEAINQNIVRFNASLNKDFENIANRIREKINKQSNQQK